MVTVVRGGFTGFDACLETDSAGVLRAAGAVRVDTIDTGHALRDEHLRGTAYFDAAGHPEIGFASTAIDLDGEEIRMVGELTIKGTTRPIELHGHVTLVDDRAVLDVSGALRRREFGIDSSELLDAGIADKVTPTLHLSLVQDGT